MEEKETYAQREVRETIEREKALLQEPIFKRRCDMRDDEMLSSAASHKAYAQVCEAQAAAFPDVLKRDVERLDFYKRDVDNAIEYRSKEVSALERIASALEKLTSF